MQAAILVAPALGVNEFLRLWPRGRVFPTTIRGPVSDRDLGCGVGPCNAAEHRAVGEPGAARIVEVEDPANKLSCGVESSFRRPRAVRFARTSARQPVVGMPARRWPRLFLSRRGAQLEHERRAAAGGRTEQHAAAAHGLGTAWGDRQAETGACAFRRVAALEALEDPLALGWGHPRPRIGHGDARNATLDARANGHVAAWGTVAHRVVNQVAERLAQQRRIARHDATARALDPEIDPPREGSVHALSDDLDARRV